ncbi:hypothetical protein VFPBJ_05574 [Purpureocillium lilacinum]|uniref:Uncharacterized protein n=1 Tax=Purpureocillium lilacinum TaxID=33203 RepID=A0A179GS91_PURLI|nr:hypothetical protein VFPBJ_05574 [Purpureocillium lilacinum]
MSGAGDHACYINRSQGAGVVERMPGQPAQPCVRISRLPCSGSLQRETTREAAAVATGWCCHVDVTVRQMLRGADPSSPASPPFHRENLDTAGTPTAARTQYIVHRTLVIRPAVSHVPPHHSLLIATTDSVAAAAQLTSRQTESRNLLQSADRGVEPVGRIYGRPVSARQQPSSCQPRPPIPQTRPVTAATLGCITLLDGHPSHSLRCSGPCQRSVALRGA